MKVRNIVRGGAVVALSLGLASVGTGMGSTASQLPSENGLTSQSAVSGANDGGIGPNLLCDPGFTCGTPQYFYSVGYTGSGPDGSMVCAENSYDKGRFGTVYDLCAGGSSIYFKWALGGIACGLAGYAAIDEEASGEIGGVFKNGQKFVAACGSSGLFFYLGATLHDGSVPVQAS